MGKQKGGDGPSDRTSGGHERSEARDFHALAEHSSDMIARLDRALRYLYVNPAFEWATGIPRAALIGKTNRDLGIPPDILETWDQAIWQVFQTGQELEIEFSYLTPNGMKRFDARLVPESSADGTVPTILAITRDVTERTESEGKLQFQAQLLSVVGQAIIATDMSGTILYWNGFAEKLYGWKSEEVLGKQVLEITPSAMTLEQAGAIMRTLASGGTWEGEFEVQRRDGSTFVAYVSDSPIFEGDRQVGIVGVSIDITERKAAEEALREADRRKDEFLASLAHELRNPLAPLRYMLELLKIGGDDVPLDESVRGMERQVGQLVRLVDDLLDVSRITCDRLELRKERVDLAMVVQQAVETARPLVSAGKHTLQVSLPAAPIQLHADPVRLVQVFGNLLTNACRYTEPGGSIRLTVDREGSEVVVRVKDSGVGIPPDKLTAVFEMFTQLSNRPDTPRSGLGIGLTLVRRLVELHGGSIVAFSEGLGRGSEFTVRLPLPADEGSPAHEPAERPGGVGTATGRRILVVDDDLMNATMLARLLRKSGNDILEAHDGLEAVEAAERFHPHVVLLDIGLPKLDGYAACRRIREEPWGKDMLLVALTGWGQEEDRRKAAAAGFNVHLVKPVNYSDLERLLASIKN